MQDYIYSAIAFVAMVIHLIINSNRNHDQAVVSARGSREYRVFLNEAKQDARTKLFTGILFKPITYNNLVAALSATD